MMEHRGLPSLIILEEPKWLSGGSHTSVFNGGLLGSHIIHVLFVWLQMELFWLHRLP